MNKPHFFKVTIHGIVIAAILYLILSAIAVLALRLIESRSGMARLMG